MVYGTEDMRAYMRARREAWAERGLCVYCGGERDGKYKVCGDCRALARVRAKKYYDKKRAAK